MRRRVSFRRRVGLIDKGNTGRAARVIRSTNRHGFVVLKARRSSKHKKLQPSATVGDGVLRVV